MKLKRKPLSKPTPTSPALPTREALIAFLWEAITTPVSQIDEHHWLAQEAIRY